MKFCPKCETKLKEVDSSLRCLKCGHTEDEQSKRPKDSTDSLSNEFNVFEGDEGEVSHPTIKMQCEKCDNDEAIWWMLQTRSADEPTTRFYRCTQCRYTWRDYS